MKYMGALGLAAAGLLGCGGDVTGAGGNGTGGQGGSTATGVVTTTGTGVTTTGTGVVTTSGTGVTTSTGTGTTTTGVTTTGTGMGCGMCDPAYFACCGNVCANLQNDINNCGVCGKVCPGPSPFCSGGVCGTPPCNIANGCNGGTCCDSVCCSSGELCCEVQQGGPVSGPICTKPTEAGTCPLGCPGCVCASPDTPIATPGGERPIASLKQGDLVYSVHQGRVVAVPVRLTTSVPAPDHVVMQVTLAGGRVLEISPKHPTADGRPFGALRAGDSIDGVPILSARAIPYTHDRTHDILPDSDTATYFAGGALVGSTLAPNAATVRAPTAPWSPAE
jgi:hypothetical protein